MHYQNPAHLVSVVVPTRNRGDKLAEALRSVLAQTFSNFEIIVVNDGGMDVGPIVDALNGEGRISLFTHAEGKGAPAARNTGLRAAKGEYIAYLDDDDLFYPDHLETLVSGLETSGFVVAYTDACRAYQVFDNGQYVVEKREVPYSRDFNPDFLLVWNIAPIDCFMHARSCLNEVGVFDEALPPLEDWDLWIRLSRKFPFRHIKKVTCEVSWRSDGTSLTSGRRADFIRMTRNLYEKHVELAGTKAEVRALQRTHLSFLEEDYSHELRIQDLVQKACSDGRIEDPLVRELLSETLTMRERNTENRAAMINQERRIKELEEFAGSVRANPLFKMYHWLKHIGRA